jgi:hypothetical protein
MVSAKMCEDNIFKNIDWVEIGQNTYSIKIINRMEIEFLNLINFSLYISSEEYQSFCLYLASNFQIFYVPSPVYVNVSTELLPEDCEINQKDIGNLDLGQNNSEEVSLANPFPIPSAAPSPNSRTNTSSPSSTFFTFLTHS